MSAINVYLTFNGNCREAMDFYSSVFGATIDSMQTFADGPESGADGDSDRIMHASMSFDNGSLMASDTPEDSPDLVVGDNFSLTLETKSPEQTDDWLEQLSSDGGAVTMPAEKTFWGSYFGMCRDRFGINWMVMCDD